LAFFTSICGKFINGGGFNAHFIPLTVLQMWLKVGIAVGPLAILDKINLKCMLVIMIKTQI
jgi:hypothetical protein